MIVTEENILDYVKSIADEIAVEFGISPRMVSTYSSMLTKLKYVSYGTREFEVIICGIEKNGESFILVIDNVEMFRKVDLIDHEYVKESLRAAFKYCLESFAARQKNEQKQ